METGESEYLIADEEDNDIRTLCAAYGLFQSNILYRLFKKKDTKARIAWIVKVDGIICNEEDPGDVCEAGKIRDTVLNKCVDPTFAP